jgi:predicted ABC-type ATPase
MVLAIAGPNGAGKTTFYHTYIAQAALRYLSADVLAHEINLNPYIAADLAKALRHQLVQQRVSFVFETVFSDEVGDKLNFLKQTADSGYTVVLCFIGLDDAALSGERVAMRVSQGGHDVPDEKIQLRFPRTLSNLKKAIGLLPLVYVFDNSHLEVPFRKVALFRKGKLVEKSKNIPHWFAPLI